MDFSWFYYGSSFDAYEYLGTHVVPEGVVFRTYAPNAEKISVILDNKKKEIPMKPVHDGRFWEVTVKNAAPGTVYKYRIYDKAGEWVDHCDPYGFGMELRPKFGSIVRDMNSYQFNDDQWLSGRNDHKNGPLNVFEVHLGSFRKPENRPDSWYNYEEMADILIPYLKENGYNYLEVMPLNEHPSDESWGYQSTGFFSPTSRYGTADQLKAFVDKCHQNGIGVIMDYVPVHFALDAYGLANYDGTPLYEYADPALGLSEWGTCNFMHSRGEVRSFLQSAANFWIKEFHFDGLRMDAISRAVYWQGDPNRGVNNDAVAFLQGMNQALKNMYPGIILAAEDSSAFAGITKPVWEGGLGFDYKWDMGWMNDTLHYFSAAPDQRTPMYHKLTFSMWYYYNDRFMLPLSHDEVVNGRNTILQKMFGPYHDKLAQARAFYLYMYAHPGKKLNFMGNEIGHMREWDPRLQQDWNLLEDPNHRNFQQFISGLNHVYLKHPALYERDYERSGFRWLDCNQESRCIYAFERICDNERIIAVFNFSDREHNFTIWPDNLSGLRVIYASSMDFHDIYYRNWEGGFNIDLKPYSAVYYQAV